MMVKRGYNAFLVFLGGVVIEVKWILIRNGNRGGEGAVQFVA